MMRSTGCWARAAIASVPRMHRLQSSRRPKAWRSLFELTTFTRLAHRTWLWEETMHRSLAATAAGAALMLAGLSGGAPAQAAAAATPASDTRPTVAVMYFTDGAIGASHNDLHITELSGNPGIRVVERDNLKKMMDEQDLSATARVDQETAVKLGKLLG